MFGCCKCKNPYIIFVVITNALAFMCLGLSLSWASPSMVKLMGPDSPIPLNNSQASWVGSLLAIGAVAAASPYTYLFNKFGRKRIIIGLAVFHISGWIVLIFASEIWHLYVGRFIFGVAVGPTYGIIPVYLAETIGKKVRGAGVAILIISQSIGALMQYTIGPILPLRTHNIMSIIPPLFLLIFSFVLPETPYYLIGKRKLSEARNVLIRLRAAKDYEEVKEEFEDIVKCLDESPPMSFSDLLKELPLRRTKVVIAIIAIGTFAQQMSGIGAIIVYMETIFQKMDSPISPKHAVVIAEILGDITVLITLFLIDKMGRKPLLTFSAIVFIIAQTLTGIFFILKNYSIIDSSYSYMGVFGIFLIQIGFGLGLGSIPVLVMSEVMSFSLKGWLSGFYLLIQGLYNAFSIKLFQIVNDDFGEQYSFWIFALCIFFSVSGLMLFMPETKNKSLHEIQNMLSKEKNDHVKIENQNKQIVRSSSV